MAAPRRAGTTTPSNSVASATGYAEASEMDKYRLVSNIGQGSFGVISKVQRINDNKVSPKLIS
jgi:NIMA (never in mitosis gene a)-related kinase